MLTLRTDGELAPVCVHVLLEHQYRRIVRVGLALWAPSLSTTVVTRFRRSFEDDLCSSPIASLQRSCCRRRHRAPPDFICYA